MIKEYLTLPNDIVMIIEHYNGYKTCQTCKRCIPFIWTCVFCKKILDVDVDSMITSKSCFGSDLIFTEQIIHDAWQFWMTYLKLENKRFRTNKHYIGQVKICRLYIFQLNEKWDVTRRVYPRFFH